MYLLRNMCKWPNNLYWAYYLRKKIFCTKFNLKATIESLKKIKYFQVLKGRDSTDEHVFLLFCNFRTDITILV